jgi:hypothetical protein
MRRDRWIVAIAIFWIAVLNTMLVRSAIWPRVHSLYPTYAAAGEDWYHGRSTYFHDEHVPWIDQYRYSPIVSASFVPYIVVPERLGNIVWRLVNAAVFFGGVWWWLRRGVPVVLSPRQIAWVFLLLMPLSVESLNNGQPNPMLIGLMLMCVTAAAGQRWWLSAATCTLAVVLKLYPVSLALLLAGLYPRKLLWRLGVTVAVAFVLPFLVQRPAYVWNQYAEWYRLLAGDERRFGPIVMMYRDLWMLLRVWHVPMTTGLYQAIQLAGAAGCAALCWMGQRRGWDRQRQATTTLILCCCWIMLVGPATEACTYVLMSPPLAYVLVAGRSENWPPALQALAWLSFLVSWITVSAGTFPDGAAFQRFGLYPLSALLLTIAAVTAAIRGLRRPATSEPIAQGLRHAA